MNPKAVFLEDKELVKWWVSVVHDNRFEKVMALALATLAVRKPTTEHLMGACSFNEILNTLSDPDLTSAPFPSPGLIHEIPKRVTDKPDQPKS